MRNRLARALFAGAVTLALISVDAARALAQSPTVITGRVVNEAKAPIAGATVLIENTQVGTTTNEDGRYTLSVPGSMRGSVVLTLRFIGFKLAKQTVNLTGIQQAIDWTLTAQATQLTGIVVTALSQQREKQTIGTSQQEVSGEALTKVAAPNLISALSGKVSGVTINQSGNMGGSSRIVIRGAGSILGENQPLFIVDGLPVSNRGFSGASASGGRDYGSAIGDLNADDIQSLTVLKGPNAAALYGSRATNGAVVITTKNGRNQPAGTKVTFTSRMSTEKASVLPTYQNSYGQGFGGEFKYVDGAGSGVNDGADESWGPKLDGRLIDQFSGKAQPWIAHPDNVSGYIQTGSTISNNLAVTTSGHGMGARLSLTKDQTTGLVPNTSLNRLTGNLSANATIKEKLNINGSLQYTQNNGNNRPENGYTEGNPFMSFTWFGRQVDVASLKDKYYNKDSPYGFADGSLYNWNDNYHRNPWWQFYANPAPDSRERVIAQVSANYEFFPWLNGTLRTGGDSYRFTQEEHFAPGNIDRADPAYNGGFTNATSRAKETNFEGLLIAKKTIGWLDLTGQIGGNKRRNDQYNNAFATRGILVPGIYNLANAGIAPTTSNSEFHSAVNSTYGSGTVTVNNVWTVDVTGRNDWSSTLPKDNASYFYPSVSTSLILSDLFPAITKNDWITYAKIRGGRAQVGSDAAPYQLQTLYNGQSAKFGGLPLYSLANTSANANLKPERTTASEGGVELSFFNDRITMDATYYVKKTRDQIINLTIAPATGFTATAINAGQISNKGIEALISITPIKTTGGLRWTTTINYTRNRSRVDELYPGLATQIIASQWGANIEARQGQPYGVLFGYGWVRDSATKKLLLTDGLPVRESAKKILGNVNPDWVGGWANEVRFKNYTLNTLLDIKHGGQNFSVGNWWGMYAGILESTLEGREVDWNKPGKVVDGIDKATGKQNTVVVTAEDYAHNLYPVNEAGVFSTGFAKLREVRLGWQAPTSLANKLRLSEFNLAIVGRNLYTWTKFPNYDPENSSNAGNGAQGFDMGAMPTTRSFGLNLTITP